MIFIHTILFLPPNAPYLYIIAYCILYKCIECMNRWSHFNQQFFFFFYHFILLFSRIIISVWKMNSQSVCIKISLLFWRIYSKCTQIVYVCRHVVAIVASILVRSCVPLKVWSDFYIVLHPNFVVFWMTSISFLFHPRTVKFKFVICHCYCLICRHYFDW